MLTIPYIPGLNSLSLPEGTELLDSVNAQPLSCLNWQQQFPYCPDVHFRMAHNGEELFIRFTVKEKAVRALATQDNGEVYKDSCVEFFIAVDDSGYYYNLEFSCIGTLLLGYRPGRTGAVHADAEHLAMVKRYSTLGNQPFAEKETTGEWALTVVIPASSLFAHHLEKWSGLHARMNLYKCGDYLSTPHYLSWAPISTPQPDFHRPEYFQPVAFQE